jgi:carbamoyl-phosphate synthase small subunit
VCNKTVPYRLILQDGTELSGESFGSIRAVAGEVVFNTAMTGYVETLTDPSYRGQIVVLTYPLVGNYGVPAARLPGSLDEPYESSRIQVQGLIVQSYVDGYSHYTARRSLAQWLQSENIPAVTGIDTRTLTRRLREHGTMRGCLVPAAEDSTGALQPHANLIDPFAACETVDMRQVCRLVAENQVIEYPGGPLRVLVVDAGIKDNIIRSMLRRGLTVIRAPWYADIATLAKGVDGVLIGNGPGDPKDLGILIENIRILLGTYDRPIFGVCLGNQILALAAGGDTTKLSYGHRGVNHPVQDLLTRRFYITSQNHGYVVQQQNLPNDWEPWFINVNDGSNEGIRCRTKPFFSVQFHPEARPGPQETGFLFDDFTRLVGAMAATARRV